MTETRHYLLFIILPILFLCILPSHCLAKKQIDYSSAVWFDSQGRFHTGDLLKYLNDVQTGKITDKEIHSAISEILKPTRKIKNRHIKKIIKKLDPLKHTAAIYTLAPAEMTAHAEKIAQNFIQPSGKSGDLDLSYFAIQLQGNAFAISGISHTNILIAIPADPEIASQFSLDLGPEKIPLIESVIIQAFQESKWSSIAHNNIPPATGKMKISGLQPGPWIIYMNQHNCMTICCRVLIHPGKTTKLNATDVLWRATLGK